MSVRFNLGVSAPRSRSPSWHSTSTGARIWDELFPAEQQRIVRSLVERVTVGLDGAEIRLRVEGLASLARDLGLVGAERAAA
jgi:hypothetical protein